MFLFVLIAGSHTAEYRPLLSPAPPGAAKPESRGASHTDSPSVARRAKGTYISSYYFLDWFIFSSTGQQDCLQYYARTGFIAFTK